ncbi:hypothetical protein IU448_23570 [Nocardia flavorosea]|nr:hypothetical protein [Nocardia flavorosea]
MYRSHLDLPAGTGAADAAAAEQSLAVTVDTVTDAAVVEHARSAFADAVQTTSFLAAGLLVVSAMVAWRVIPSPRDVEVNVDDSH